MENRFKQLRKQRGITQKELGKALNRHPQTISKWELGLLEPDIRTLFQITDYFGVTVEYLYCHD